MLRMKARGEGREGLNMLRMKARGEGRGAVRPGDTRGARGVSAPSKCGQNDNKKVLLATVFSVKAKGQGPRPGDTRCARGASSSDCRCYYPAGAQSGTVTTVTNSVRVTGSSGRRRPRRSPPARRKPRGREPALTQTIPRRGRILYMYIYYTQTITAVIRCCHQTDSTVPDAQWRSASRHSASGVARSGDSKLTAVLLYVSDGPTAGGHGQSR
jgi:hypothetical protein